MDEPKHEADKQDEQHEPQSATGVVSGPRPKPVASETADQDQDNQNYDEHRHLAG